MLVAVDAVGSRRVASVQARGGDFACPECRQSVVVRAGERIVPHFAHQRGQDCSRAQDAAKRRRDSARRRAEHERLLSTGQQELFDVQGLSLTA